MVTKGVFMVTSNLCITLNVGISFYISAEPFGKEARCLFVSPHCLSTPYNKCSSVSAAMWTHLLYLLSAFIPEFVHPSDQHQRSHRSPPVPRWGEWPQESCQKCKHRHQWELAFPQSPSRFVVVTVWRCILQLEIVCPLENKTSSHTSHLHVSILEFLTCQAGLTNPSRHAGWKHVYKFHHVNMDGRAENEFSLHVIITVTCTRAQYRRVRQGTCFVFLARFRQSQAKS